ncbi:MAG: sugar-binding protein [Armatimonadota bacterium]
MSISLSPRPARGRRPAWLLAGALLPLSVLLASCTTEPPSTGNGGGNAAPVASTGENGGGATGTPATAEFETPRKPEGPLKFVIVTNGISPFWDPMAVGMKDAAEELGVEASWRGPDPANVANQKKMLEEALATNPDGIALSCIEGDASKEMIDMVISKGVPLVTFDSDSTGSRRLAYIGTNNVTAGEAAGRAAAELLPNGGEFLGFVGNISAENARERQEGFEKTAKEAGITLKEVIGDDKDPARARSNVENALQKYPDVDGLLGLYSYNGPAIVQAVGNRKSQYKVVAFDAEPQTLQALDKGLIDATIVQKPYDFGYLSVKLLTLINRKGFSEAKKEMNIPDSLLYDTGVETITPANVKEYRDKLAKMGIKSS